MLTIKAPTLETSNWRVLSHTEPQMRQMSRTAVQKGCEFLFTGSISQSGYCKGPFLLSLIELASCLASGLEVKDILGLGFGISDTEPATNR